MTLPQAVLSLPTDGEIVADPEVALAVEHGLAARAIPAAVELERQDPGAGCPVEVRHERNRAQVLVLQDRVELVEQGEEPLRLVPGMERDGLGRRQRVRRGGRLGEALPRRRASGTRRPTPA